MVYLLTQLSTHSSHTAKAGLQGSALPGCPALLSSYAKVTLWYHCMYMQHITTLQVQGMYGIPPDTTQHTLIAHRKGRASRVALPGCPALLSSYAKVTLWYHCMYMQHITTLQVQGMYGIHPDTTQQTLIAHRKGRASRVSPSRLPCPAVIICQGDIVVSLHVHAAYHNTASSGNVWYTS